MTTQSKYFLFEVNYGNSNENHVADVIYYGKNVNFVFEVINDYLISLGYESDSINADILDNWITSSRFEHYDDQYPDENDDDGVEYNHQNYHLIGQFDSLDSARAKMQSYHTDWGVVYTVDKVPAKIEPESGFLSYRDTVK